MTARFRILVLCTGNSCRSQMAEALIARAGGDAVEVHSAGTHPSTVNPLTVAALGEIGIDWSAARSTPMSDYLGQPFDLVVTVCDEVREACPYFPGARRQVHSGYRDPALATGTPEERLAVFREVRDSIAAWAPGFVAEALAGRDRA